MEKKGSIRCAKCKRFISNDYKGACPNCGSINRTVDVSLEEGLQVSDSGSTYSVEYPKKWICWASIAIAIASCTSGLFFGGGAAAIIGILFALASLYVGHRTIQKIEIRGFEK